MKFPRLVFQTSFVFGCSFLFHLAIALAQPAAAAKSEPDLFAATFEKPGMHLTFEEIERQEQYSVVRIEAVDVSSAQGSVLVARTMASLAAERQAQYFFQASRGFDEEGHATFRLYLVDDPKMPLRRLLRGSITGADARFFRESGYQKTSEELEVYSWLGLP